MLSSYKCCRSKALRQKKYGLGGGGEKSSKEELVFKPGGGGGGGGGVGLAGSRRARVV